METLLTSARRWLGGCIAWRACPTWRASCRLLRVLWRRWPARRSPPARGCRRSCGGPPKAGDTSEGGDDQGGQESDMRFLVEAKVKTSSQRAPSRGPGPRRRWRTRGHGPSTSTNMRSRTPTGAPAHAGARAGRGTRCSIVAFQLPPSGTSGRRHRSRPGCLFVEDLLDAQHLLDLVADGALVLELQREVLAQAHAAQLGAR